MNIKWTDLRVGDELAFTTKFIEYAKQDPIVSKWFLEEVVPLKIPQSFEISNVNITHDTIRICFDWDMECWTISNDGILKGYETHRPSPVVFDIISLTE